MGSTFRPRRQGSAKLRIAPLPAIAGIGPYEQMIRTILSEHAEVTLGDVFGAARGQTNSARGIAARTALLKLAGLSPEKYSAAVSRALVDKRLQEEASLAAMTEADWKAYNAKRDADRAADEAAARMGLGVNEAGEWQGEYRVFKNSEGKVVRVSRAELEQAQVRLANASQREFDNRQKKQWIETEHKRLQLQASYKSGLAKLISNVSSMISKTSVLSSHELRQVIGASLALLSEYELEAVVDSIREITREISRTQLYYMQSAALQSMPFTLFINDSNYIRAGADIANILSTVSFTTEKEIIAILYGALDAAFNEAWSSLSGRTPNEPGAQFPFEYREQIKAVIDDAFESERIRVTRGPKNTAQPWEVLVDFNKLFGDLGDLSKAYHEGALKKGGGKVHIPYTGTDQDLKNPVQVRYAFWRAMWEGRTWYTPAAEATTRAEHSKNMRERRLALTKRLEQLREQQALQQAELASRMGEPATLRNKPKESWTSLGDIPGEVFARTIQDTNDRIASLDRQLAFANKYKSTQPRKMKNPGQYRAWTIAQRVAIFKSPPKAPFWILLEYGQLRWEPKIPPKGVWSRYQKIVRESVSALFRDEANRQYGAKKGYTVQPDAGGTGVLVKSPYPAPGETAVVINAYKNYSTKNGKKSDIWSAVPIIGPTLPTVGASGYELNEDDYIKTIYQNIQGNISIAARDNPKAAAAARQATAKIVDRRVRGADVALPRMPSPAATLPYAPTRQWSPETRKANPKVAGTWWAQNPRWWETSSAQTPISAKEEKRGQTILRQEIEARRKKLGL